MKVNYRNGLKRMGWELDAQKTSQKIRMAQKHLID
jgi:hypothetical protein